MVESSAKRKAMSIDDLQKLVAAHPRRSDYRYKLSRALTRTKDSQGALIHGMQALDKASLKNKVSPRHYENLLAILIHQRMPKIAEMIGMSAANAGITSPTLSALMARSLLTQKQGDMAAKWIEHGMSQAKTEKDRNPLKLAQQLMAKKKSR